MKIRFLFSALLALGILSGCDEDPVFPDIPSIEFISFEVVNNDAIITIEFKDGDGDVGENIKQDSSNIETKNLLLTYYRKIDGVFKDSIYMDSSYVDSSILDTFYVDTVFVDSMYVDSFYIDSIYKYAIVTGSFKKPLYRGPSSHRMPYLTPSGRNKVLEGEIKVRIDYPWFDLPLARLGAEPGDTVRYDIQIVDRALNYSNVVSTGDLIVP